jgi:ubiquinol-cytochrome c reductase iron-sulfur subunit
MTIGSEPPAATHSALDVPAPTDVAGPRSGGPDGGAERTSFGRNPRHFGIEPDEPWPDDVPMDQDDTHWRYEDDPAGARRAELRVVGCWTITVLASIGLAVVYLEGASTQWAGVCWGLAFIALGVGLILWARDLLPGHEVIASRGSHDHSPAGDQVAVAESMERGVEPMARRPFLLLVLGGAGGIFGLASLFPFASLGPRPGNDLWHTRWGPGVRAVNVDGTPVHPDDVAVNGIMTIFPEHNIDDALSSTLLINHGPGVPIPGSREGWSLGTLVAFSKICTHAGCPAGLYNVSTHQLICPCHQSTFDVLEGCKPVFGPAPRSLPQLPISTNAEGYVVSVRDYATPVGPGFWERG